MSAKPARTHAQTQQDNLEMLFAQAPALVAILRGRDGVVELFNPQFREVWGNRDVLGKSMRAAFPELVGQGWFEMVEQVYSTGKPIKGHAKPATLVNGRQAFFDFVYQPYLNNTGKTIGVMIFGVEVTRQIDAVRQARQSEERYQAFIQHSNEGIWRFELDKPIAVDLPPDKQIQLVYKHAYLAEANDAMVTMYGVGSVDDLIGMRLSDLFAQDPRNEEYLRAFIESGYSLSGVDSHEVDVHGNDKYFRNSLVGVIEDGCVVRAWGTQQDVTEQHKAEQALRASETRLALALKASQMGIWEWKVQTNELTWSDELKQIFGLKPTDEITYEKYLSLLHPDDRPNLQKIIKEALRTGKEYRVEHRCIWPDRSVHWLLGQGKAFMEGGKPVRMLGTSMNIDDRKLTEDELHASEAINEALKSQQAQLVELNNSKDEFISLASHQLRTPATGVKQYIGMLIEGYCGKLTPQQLGFLDVAYQSNERQLRIIDDLLKVAHVDAGRVTLVPEPTNLVALISDVVAEQSSVFGKRNQQVAFECDAAKIIAEVDPGRVRMVLENLIDNASKYSLQGKRITVRLEEHPHEVEIRVKDKGVGIAKKDVEKLFQKFSRVNNELSTLVGGTGLGLYWAKKIVDLHEGTIRVESKPHRGSDFIITLPKRRS